jgi:hypothetical protein
MILLEIDLKSVTVLKLEWDAPGTVDMDGVASRPEAAQRMEIVPGDIHAFGIRRSIQRFKSANDTFVQPGVYLGRRPLCPKVGQRPASERSDHGRL